MLEYYLILITKHFFTILFLRFLLRFVSIYQAFKAVFDQISKQLVEIRHNYTDMLRIFNSHLGVLKCAQTRPSAYHINAARIQGFKQFRIHARLL